jgi:hypothetical protein
MAYQKENIQDPTGLGTIFEDVEFVVTTQHEGSEEQREVDHVSDEDFTDETEENATPLPLIVDSSPADVSEAESQPGSAFSSSSSDEDSDADDEGAEEEDEDDVADQAEEWVDPNDNSLSPPPPAEEVLVQPAVVGLRYFWGETYDLYKFDGKRYHSSSSDSEKYKRKKRRHRKATSTRAVRPSPLRTASIRIRLYRQRISPRRQGSAYCQSRAQKLRVLTSYLHYQMIKRIQSYPSWLPSSKLLLRSVTGLKRTSRTLPGFRMRLRK